MANSPSEFDPTIPLATFLATPVGDGTWADIIQAAKSDAVPADASDIDTNAGQLWGNFADDVILWVYAFAEQQTAQDASLVDTRATPAVGTLPGGAGSEVEIPIVLNAEVAELRWLRVISTGATTTAHVRIYAETGKVGLLYETDGPVNIDAAGTGYVDGTPATLLTTDGDGLADMATAYVVIENASLGAGDVEIQVVSKGLIHA